MVAFLAIILGLSLGSFANVLIDRVPDGKSIRGRSRCDRCRRTLRWWELVPVLSAFILRHRCPTCAGTIAFRNTAVELGCAGVLVAVLIRHGSAVTPQGVIEAFGLLSLGVLAIIDLRHGIVPDQISLPAIVIVAIARLVNSSLFPLHSSLPISSSLPSALSSLAVSMVVGAGFFAVQRFVSRGRWVGDGDIRVGALMGALFVTTHLVLALAAAYIIGGAIAAALLLTRHVERGSRIPLVPFLFAGSVVVVMWGEQIVEWYQIG
ncbi:prepilin peptidase [Candidatus Uhrbacteria bacterium]|nr:prepilin peptidase [Candidatus Uhrbacteria bacterium]